MKVIAFILSAYLLFLFAIPCCAFDNCPEEKTNQQASHEKGDGDCGSCSPFFTCTGCSGFTISFENTTLETISSFSGHQYAGYIVSSIPDVHYDFWQPPKLA
jgi:Family of unknown function (DUF6660)